MKKKYRLLFENSPLPMWILDLNTQKFLEVNKAAIEHYGYSKEEFSEMIITDLNPSKTRISDIEKDTYEPGTLVTSRHIKKNNEIISVEVIFHTIEYEGKEARLVLSNDITERLKAQEDLIRAKKEAEKSDKLKSEFLAQMSHEIRSPINTLLNFISLIKETVPKPLNEDMSFCFNAIDSSSGRLIRTIDLILNMSQIQTGSLECNFQVIDLHKDVLQSILNEYSPLAESKELKLNLHNEYGIPRVTADVYSVGQIFSNLINNAIKYTKTGEIGIRIYGNKGAIMVDVSDTGIGISKEYLSEIFTPFSQEEQGYTRRFEGNGLGLALVKKYCELNKTSISVQSEKGVGTVFTVTFPGDSI